MFPDVFLYGGAGKLITQCVVLIKRIVGYAGGVIDRNSVTFCKSHKIYPTTLVAGIFFLFKITLNNFECDIFIAFSFLKSTVKLSHLGVDGALYYVLQTLCAHAYAWI